MNEFGSGPWGKQCNRCWLLGYALGSSNSILCLPAGYAASDLYHHAIESINARLRKIIKSLGHFLNDDAAPKLIWLELRNITASWGSAAHDWKSVMNQFAILYGDRFIGPSWGKSGPS